MLVLRTESDEATSWPPFVRPDPWLNQSDVSLRKMLSQHNQC